MQKQELLTRIGQSLVALKTKVSSRDILNNLRRKIKQQTEAITEDTNVICYHMPDYTWEMAFRKLEDQQNSGLSSFPLQDSDLRSVILCRYKPQISLSGTIYIVLYINSTPFYTQETD